MLAKQGYYYYYYYARLFIIWLKCIYLHKKGTGTVYRSAVSLILRYGTAPILAYKICITIPVLQDIFPFRKAVVHNICSSYSVPYPVPSS